MLATWQYDHHTLLPCCLVALLPSHVVYQWWQVNKDKQDQQGYSSKNKVACFACWQLGNMIITPCYRVALLPCCLVALLPSHVVYQWWQVNKDKQDQQGYSSKNKVACFACWQLGNMIITPCCLVALLPCCLVMLYISDGKWTTTNRTSKVTVAKIK